jgi:hypothetical protein
MGYRTSVVIPDDLAAAWKTSGATLTTLIRRGLTTGQTTSTAPTSTTSAPASADIAAIRARLDDLTVMLADHAGIDHEADRARYNGERAAEWHRRLYEGSHGAAFTTSQAAEYLPTSSTTTARGYLRMLVALGYARQLPDQGSSHLWQVRRIKGEKTTSTTHPSAGE